MIVLVYHAENGEYYLLQRWENFTCFHSTNKVMASSYSLELVSHTFYKPVKPVKSPLSSLKLILLCRMLPHITPIQVRTIQGILTSHVIELIILTLGTTSLGASKTNTVVAKNTRRSRNQKDDRSFGPVLRKLGIIRLREPVSSRSPLLSKALREGYTKSGDNHASG